MNENVQKCLEIIQQTAPGARLENKANGSLDDLDFIEIIMDVERAFKVTIKEDEYAIADFPTIEDLIKWMITFFPKS